MIRDNFNNIIMDTEKASPSLDENISSGTRLKVIELNEIIRMFVQRLKKPLQVRRSKELKRREKRHPLVLSI